MDEELDYEPEEEPEEIEAFYNDSKFTRCDNELFEFKEKYKCWYYLCKFLTISEVRINTLSGDVEYVITYFNNNEERTISFPGDILSKNKLLSELTLKGIDITEFNVTRILQYLLQEEKKAKHINVHTQIGWTDINNKRAFLLQKIIGLNLESEYCGELNVIPKGTFENWKRAIEKEVLGNPSLELALVLGLSSPVASLLRRLIGLDVLFFHIYGDSTTGKTTSLMLAVSPFGLPIKMENGLIKTWLATDNALLGYLKGIHGLPMAIDEASVRVNSNYTNMIYQIADGTEKGRMDANGNNKKSGKWSGTVLSSAENSLLSNSNQNNGLRVRILELGDIQWTTSAKNAENLKAELQENYGHAGIKFIEYLLQFSDDELIDTFKEKKDYVKSKMLITDNFADRIADKITTIYLTSLMACKALEMDIDTEGILELLIKADAEQAEDRNIGSKAYDYIKEKIFSNINRFIHKGNPATFDPNKGGYQSSELPQYGEIWGKLEFSGETLIEAIILRENFEKLLKEGNFTNTNLILKSWRDKGLLDCDEGKFTKKKTIFKGDSGTRKIVIKMDEKPKIQQAKKTKIIKSNPNKSSNMSKLLETEDND